MSATALLEEWKALTETAQRCIESDDLEALADVVARRDELLPALRAAGALEPSQAAELTCAEAALLSGAQGMRDIARQELSELRSARARLGEHQHVSRGPAITSRRI